MPRVHLSITSSSHTAPWIADSPAWVSRSQGLPAADIAAPTASKEPHTTPKSPLAAASAIPCTLWRARKRPSAKCQAQLLPKFSEVSTRDHLPCCQPPCHPVVDENAAPAGRQLVPQLHSMQSELLNTGGEHHGVNGLPPARPATSRLSIITCVRASQQHQPSASKQEEEERLLLPAAHP